MQEASVVDLGSPHGKMLRCQWTNVYLTRAYGIPLVDEKGKFLLDPVSLYPKRRGSFVDGAAAAAKVDYLLEAKKISPELAARYNRAIHRDFGLEEGEELQLAPYIEPTHIGDPLEYQRFCPKMQPRPDQQVTVEEVLRKRGKKKEMAETPSSLPAFYSTECNIAPTPSLAEKSTRTRRSLADFDYLDVRRCPKKGLLILLHRKGGTLGEQNPPLSKLMGEEHEGNYLILSSVPLPSLAPSTRSSTSSSPSSCSEPAKKQSKRASSKSSKKEQPSSKQTDKAPPAKSSRKRSATSAGLSEGSAKKSRASKKK